MHEILHSQNLNCLVEVFQRKIPLCAMTEERLRLGILTLESILKVGITLNYHQIQDA